MSWFAADAKCPYYQHDNIKESTVTCEGVLPGSSIKHHFGNKQRLTEGVRKYCAGDYEKCPWYTLVSMKWAREEE